MDKRIKEGIISAIVFAAVAILFGYFINGEIKWSVVVGLMIGGFISWFFIIPKISKQGDGEK